MLNWVDETTYSRNDKARIPRVWVAHVGGLNVTVYRHVHFGPAVWNLTCSPWFDCRSLPSQGSAEVAKLEAVSILRDRLTAALSGLGA